MATKRIIDATYSDSPKMVGGNAHKKLRKLPHVFSRVLELPFPSDADVEVLEGPDSFQFIAEIEVDPTLITDDVRAHPVEIHPGVVKIVLRNGQKINGGDRDVELFLDKLEVDTWRFRLPSWSRPELATADFVDGELTVTVPKDKGFLERGGVCGGGNRSLVLAL